ncbi:toll-like receptor 13 [Mugil cephalus]|uniref:toll-like receptor 13 n=1 Tax=Mugil cephalus TaxID=48193 RepID=UPI001FB7A833|nr:toll-like receptor 13 [Mugil cephalus]XP_047427412.1 toll-like receptor 13 [Mugil cephalus]
MQVSGSGPLLLLLLPHFLLHYDHSLAFSLKNCVILYSENTDANVWVTCNDHDLATIPDDIPRDVTSLDLATNHILNIARTDLTGLRKLKSVQLHYNLISHVDDGAFVDLVELSYLVLDENKLTNLTDNMFYGLSKLRMLSLSTNQISFISPVAFQSLVSLEEVNLGSNHLHQATDIAPILNLPFIKYLYIGYNRFTSFQSGDLLLNASNLRSLSLSLNPLRKFSVTRDVFPHLNTLDFSMCSTDIEWDVANKTFLRSLTTLFFSGSYVSFESYRAMLQTADSLHELILYSIKKRIDEGLLDVACKIPSLRSLEVTFCELVTIDNVMLRPCSRLTKLSLSGNQLSGMSEHALQSMTKLTTLDLSINHLTKVPVTLRGLSSLEVLDASSNLISELDCLDFQNLTRLTNLSLKHNHIFSLGTCVFQNLNILKSLDIGQNFIFTFENTFRVNLRQLQSLNLRSNGHLDLKRGDFGSLSSLRILDLDSDTYYIVHDGAFEGLDNLQTLSMSLDRYTKETFSGLQHLEALNLRLTFKWSQNSSRQNSEPPFSNLPNLKRLMLRVFDTYRSDIPLDLLSGLKSLEYLMTQKFFTRSLHPDTFKHTPCLKGLQIINSQLSSLLPELFRPIPNLKELDLSHNKFKSLDFLAQTTLLALSWLKLSDNKLSIVNESVFHSLPALTYLDLSENPLACECSNSGLNQWVQSNNQTQAVNGHQYTCTSPVSQQGAKFLDFDVHFCWVDASFLCFISSTCLIVVTLLASFTYHFLRWHLTYAYYLFLAFLYDSKRRKTDTPQRYDAFVSYNVHDEAWVYQELVPVLEGQQGWKLCLHHRDFEPGMPIFENITEAIYNSRKTISVISRHYLQSEWCSREIQIASFRLFSEHKDVLIMVFLEDIPFRHLSTYHQMRCLVKRCTYLSWPLAGGHSGVFWQNICRALERAESPDEHAPLLTGHQSFI